MSKRTITSIIIMSVLILLSIWVFFSDSNSNTMQKTQVTAGKNKKLDVLDEVKVNDLIITETKNGKKYWEIWAVSGNYDKKMEKASLKDIKGNFYQDGHVVLSFEAPLAEYDSLTKEVTLKNTARAVNDKNVTVTAGEICWASQENKISASKKVTIIQQDKLKTVSDKAEFNTNFTHLKLTGNADSYVYK